MARTRSKRPINQGKLLAGLVVVLIAGAVAINSFSSNASQDLSGEVELIHNQNPIGGGGGGGAAPAACANKEGPCGDSNSVWQLLKPDSVLSELNSAFVIKSNPLTFSPGKGYLNNLLGQGTVNLTWKEVVRGVSTNRSATLSYAQSVRIGGYDESVKGLESALVFLNAMPFVNNPTAAMYRPLISYVLSFSSGISTSGKIGSLPLGIAYNNMPRIKLFDRTLIIDTVNSTPKKVLAYDSVTNQRVEFEMGALLPLFPGINVTNITYSKCYLNYQCISKIKLGSGSLITPTTGRLGVAGKTGPFFVSPMGVNMPGYSAFKPLFESVSFVGANYTNVSFGFRIAQSDYQAIAVSWYSRDGNLQVISPQEGALDYGVADIAMARKSSQKSITLFSALDNSTTVINDKVVYLDSIKYTPSTGTLATFYIGGRLEANPKATKVTIGPLVTWRTAYLDVAGLNPINCTIQYNGAGIVVSNGGDSMGIDMDLKTGSCDLYPEQVPIGDAKYINNVLKNPWLDLRNLTANNSTSLKCPFSTLAVVVHETSAYSPDSTIDVRPARPYADCNSVPDSVWGLSGGWLTAFRKNSSGLNYGYLTNNGLPIYNIGMTPSGGVIDSTLLFSEAILPYHGLNIFVADAVPKMNVTLRR